jgi:hypothetical protein
MVGVGQCIDDVHGCHAFFEQPFKSLQPFRIRIASETLEYRLSVFDLQVLVIGETLVRLISRDFFAG